MSEMGAYIQDILDLIEWANGDARKTKWGKIRAESGHPKPFNLKYIGIGNEDLITDIFKESTQQDIADVFGTFGLYGDRCFYRLQTGKTFWLV